MRIGVCAAPEGLSGSVDGLDFLEPSVANLLCPAREESAFAARLAGARSAPAPVEAVNCLLPGEMKTTAGRSGRSGRVHPYGLPAGSPGGRPADRVRLRRQPPRACCAAAGGRRSR